MAMPSRPPGGSTSPAPQTSAARAMFEVGFNERLPVGQALILGLQNVCGMTGMRVLPLGRALNLDPGQISYIYGMSIPTCGMKEG